MPQELASTLTILGSLVVAVIGAYVTLRSKKVEATATPYGELADRVVDLEKADRDKGEEIKALRIAQEKSERRTRINEAYIIEIVPWAADVEPIVKQHAPEKPRAPHPPAWAVAHRSTTPEGHA